jgi:hypothetical protein
MSFNYILFASSIVASLHASVATMAGAEAATIARLQRTIASLLDENQCLRDTLHQAQARCQRAHDLGAAWRRCPTCAFRHPFTNGATSGSVPGQHAAIATDFSTEIATGGYVLGSPAAAAAQEVYEPAPEPHDPPPLPQPAPEPCDLLEPPPDWSPQVEPWQVAAHPPPSRSPQGEPRQISTWRSEPHRPPPIPGLPPCLNQPRGCRFFSNERGLYMGFPGYCCWFCKNPRPWRAHGKMCQKYKQMPDAPLP